MACKIISVAILLLVGVGRTIPVNQAGSRGLADSIENDRYRAAISKQEEANSGKETPASMSSDDAIYRFIKLYREYEKTMHDIGQKRPFGTKDSERYFQFTSGRADQRNADSQVKPLVRSDFLEAVGSVNNKGLNVDSDLGSKTAFGSASGSMRDAQGRVFRAHIDGGRNEVEDEDGVDVGKDGDDEDDDDEDDDDEDDDDEDGGDRPGGYDTNVGGGIRKSGNALGNPRPPRRGIKEASRSGTITSLSNEENTKLRTGGGRHTLQEQATRTPTPIAPAHVIRSKLMDAGARLRQVEPGSTPQSGTSNQEDCRPNGIAHSVTTGTEVRADEGASRDGFEDEDDEVVMHAWQDFDDIPVGSHNGYQPIV